MLICTGCIIFKASTEHGKYAAHSGGFTYDYLSIHHKIFPAIGTIAFSYVCQHQTYLVYNTLVDKSPERFASISRVAVFVSFLVLVAMGIPGYLLFLKDTRSDVFLNFTDLSYGEAKST